MTSPGFNTPPRRPTGARRMVGRKVYQNGEQVSPLDQHFGGSGFPDRDADYDKFFTDVAKTARTGAKVAVAVWLTALIVGLCIAVAVIYFLVQAAQALGN